ncbi:hypothetical protein [Nocardioides sp. KR10-350]|uniref:hypothetical protein n=1 Tax=Nocardioides cheoyonin TaxID=3156615 RepID=UPI0032B3E3CF
MPTATTSGEREGYDATPDFVYAVSLLAALEGVAGQAGHASALPFLGMARAELTDFGQRRPVGYLPVQVDDLRAGLAELEERITALLADSTVLQHSLRLDAARRILRRGLTTLGAPRLGAGQQPAQRA